MSLVLNQAEVEWFFLSERVNSILVKNEASIRSVQVDNDSVLTSNNEVRATVTININVCIAVRTRRGRCTKDVAIDWDLVGVNTWTTTGLLSSLGIR